MTKTGMETFPQKNYEKIFKWIFFGKANQKLNIFKDTDQTCGQKCLFFQSKNPIFPYFLFF